MTDREFFEGGTRTSKVRESYDAAARALIQRFWENLDRFSQMCAQSTLWPIFVASFSRAAVTQMCAQSALWPVFRGKRGWRGFPFATGVRADLFADMFVRIAFRDSCPRRFCRRHTLRACLPHARGLPAGSGVADDFASVGQGWRGLPFATGVRADLFSDMFVSVVWRVVQNLWPAWPAG